MQRLEDPPGFADLHLAVVSTDMGAGDGSIPGCDANGGKNGVFQYAPRGGCGASGLDPGATYISNVGGVKNYTGKIEDVIACIAPLGESGCGFEHPLAAAAARPGRRRPARPRREPGVPAARSVSVRRGGDERRRLLGAAGIGPVRHQGEHVPRLDAGSADELSLQRVRPPLQRPEAAPQAAHRPRLRRRVAGRVRFGGARGHADPGGHDQDQLRTLKPYPDEQILVGAITGPASPYFVHWTTTVRGSGPMPSVSPACIASDASSAAPAVRITQWVDSFGENGVLMSACGDNFGPAFDRVAHLLNMAVPQ